MMDEAILCILFVAGVVIALSSCSSTEDKIRSQRRKDIEEKRLRTKQECKKATDLSIEFNNAEGVFAPGNEVSGTLTLTASEPIEANTVSISINGEAKTKLEMQQTSGYAYAFVPYYSNISYVNELATVWPPQSGNGTAIIPVGVHQFPFRFQLPPNCPPSWKDVFVGYTETCYAKIQYSCEAKIDRQLTKFKQTVKKPFEVIPIVDLATIPTAIQPSLVVSSRDSVLANKKIILKVGLPKSGFIIGETITAEIDIGNISVKKINHIAMSLVRCPTYEAHTCLAKYEGWLTANGPVKDVRESQIARSIQEVQVVKGTRGRFTQSLTIPHTTASFDNCPIIRMRYCLEIRAIGSGMINSSATAQVPIIIGTTRQTEPAISHKDHLSDAPSSSAENAIGTGEIKDQEE